MLITDQCTNTTIGTRLQNLKGVKGPNCFKMQYGSDLTTWDCFYSFCTLKKKKKYEFSSPVHQSSPLATPVQWLYATILKGGFSASEGTTEEWEDSGGRLSCLWAIH